MSLRVYFDPNLTIPHVDPHSKDPHISHIVTAAEKRFKEKTWVPSDWNYFALSGCRLHWDDQEGLPYIEVTNFEVGIPKVVRELSAESFRVNYGLITIVDRWTGDQPSIMIDLYDEKPVKFMRAFLSRDKDDVRLVLRSKGLAIMNVHRRYLQIRMMQEGWQSDFSKVTSLDRPREKQEPKE